VFFVVVAFLCLAFALTAGPRTSAPPQVRAKVVSSPASASWGPTRDEVALAAAYVDRMSLKQQAGQVIVAKYRGTGAPLRVLRTLHLGGVIANTGNIASTKQTRIVNARLAREFARRGYPGFVAVDQEGGLVARVRGTATRWPTFMATGAADRPGLTEEVARANGRELANLGFTVDLAPVADVTTGSGDPTIGTRSAGGRPALVARHVVAYAAGLQSAGILPVVKHFPGHGSVGTDSHRALPVQNRSRATLLASDLVPFREAVEHGVPAVMTGHIALRSENPSVPASLSSALTTGLLRDQLGFGGLVVTDALDMGAGHAAPLARRRLGSGAAGRCRRGPDAGRRTSGTGRDRARRPRGRPAPGASRAGRRADDRDPAARARRRCRDGAARCRHEALPAAVAGRGDVRLRTVLGAPGGQGGPATRTGVAAQGAQARPARVGRALRQGHGRGAWSRRAPARRGRPASWWPSTVPGSLRARGPGCGWRPSATVPGRSVPLPTCCSAATGLPGRLPVTVPGLWRQGC
jgi:beta-N-acetylhexosaminidase